MAGALLDYGMRDYRMIGRFSYSDILLHVQRNAFLVRQRYEKS